jgi:hypothetical protein
MSILYPHGYTLSNNKLNYLDSLEKNNLEFESEKGTDLFLSAEKEK